MDEFGRYVKKSCLKYRINMYFHREIISSRELGTRKVYGNFLKSRFIVSHSHDVFRIQYMKEVPQRNEIKEHNSGNNVMLKEDSTNIGY